MVLEDGVSHPVDSSEIAFKLAAIGALRQCMSIIICTPPECTTCVVKVVMHMSPKKIIILFTSAGTYCAILQ